MLVIALALVPLLPAQVTGSSQYSEKLTVYISGSDALWSLKLGGVNASSPYLTRLESIPGLNWYNVTGIKTTSWVSDFQAFGPQGYNLLPVPFVVPQGLFLKVGASSFSDAASAAQALDPYFVTSFSSLLNGSGVYSFFAPASFSQVIPATLMRLIPVSDGGFAAAIGYQSPSVAGNFTSLQSPMITLGGDRTSSGFSHYLVLADIKSSALSSSGSPSILNYFGLARSFLQASNKSTASSIELHVLDGIMTPASLAGVSNDRSRFASTYVLNVQPGSKVRALNLTIVQQLPQLLVTRTIDAGVLAPGKNVDVTLTFRNLSNASTISNATLADNWWQSYGFFKLVSGTSNIDLPKLSKGAALNPTYELQYTGNSSHQVTIPPATVSYSYAVSSPVNGKQVNSTITLYSDVNGASLLLGSGVLEPVVFTYLATSSGVGGSVGSAQNIKVVVKNVGNRTANDVVVNGQSVGALLAGATLSVPFPVTAPSLARTNLTESYTVQYTTPENQLVTLGTNQLRLLFTHTSMKMGLGELRINSTTSLLSGGRTNLTLSFATSNQGAANLTVFSATGQLPQGLECGKTAGKNITCTNGSFTLNYSSVKAGVPRLGYISFIVTQPRNYMFGPFSFVFNSSGYKMTGSSNGVPVPTGLVLSKSFSPSLLFGGMSSRVSLIATDAGPYPFYNVTVITSQDLFDSLPAGTPLLQTVNESVSPVKPLTFSYNVTVASDYGNQTGQPVGASFFFGGIRFSTSSQSGHAVIYQPLSASISSSPATPMEGKRFSIIVTITNPSPLTVSDVRFSLPLPAEINVISATNASVSNGQIAINANQLAKNGVYSANVTATSSSGISIPFSGSKLTFSYAGLSIKGHLPGQGIVINEDVLTRYVLPIGLALVVLLAVAVVVRRMARPSAPVSLK
jgi:hypothetical protein